MMKKPIVISAANYDKIDGRQAFHSPNTKLTLALDDKEPVLQIWQTNGDGEETIHTQLPLHQVMDLMIFLSRTLLHFQEAYRFPLLYNPENPTIERIGLQGGVMPLTVATENPTINQDMMTLSQCLNDLGELTGERLRVLNRLLKEMEYC